MPAVINGNDEYALEAALKLVEAPASGEVTLLSMAPAECPRDAAQGARDGRDPRGPRHGPGAGRLVVVSTARVLAAALATLEFDLVLAGVDTSDGVGGVVAGGIARPSRTPVPVVCRPDRARRGGRDRPVRRITPTGYDLWKPRCRRSSACTQALGEPRYPSLKGIMAARDRRRSRPGRWPTSAWTRRRSVARWPRRDVIGQQTPPPAPRPRSSAGTRRGGRREDRRLPGRAAARLMGTIWIVAEAGPDGGLARISAEVATLARELGRRRRDVAGIVVGGRARSRRAASSRLRAGRLVRGGSLGRGQRLVGGRGGPCRRGLATGDGSEARPADAILVGAGPDGRDLAGALSALTGWACS